MGSDDSASECPNCGKRELVDFAYHWACLWCAYILAKTYSDIEDKE